MTGDKERCLSAGMNAYISKPVHSAHLLATIEAYYTKPDMDVPPIHPNDLMKPFLARANDGLLELRKSVESADLKTLEEQVKHLKAAAESIFAAGVVDGAKRVQLAIESKNIDAVTHSLLLLEGEITRLQQSETVTTTYTAS